MSANEAVVITGEGNIRAFQLLALKSALKLETMGIRASRRYRASVLVREQTGLTEKNKKKLLKAYEQLLRDAGILL